MKKIKIVFITASVKGGGAERVLINIINSLDESKYEVSLVNTFFGDKPNGLNQNIPYITYSSRHTRNAFFKLYKYIRRVRPTYIFTTSATVGYLLVILRALLQVKSRIIIRVAVTPSESVQHGVKSTILKKLIKLTYNHSDTIIAQTQFMRQDLISSFDIDPGKIKIIRNIVDRNFLERYGNEFSPSELNLNYFNIVASGALYSVKGFDLLIEAIAKLKFCIPRIKLFILGDERYEYGYKHFLEGLIESYNLEETVSLLGYRENPYPYYKNADLFVLSSRTEGYPNVVLESLFYNTPVVVTDCVNFSDIICNGKNGFIVERNSVISLKKGIEAAYKSVGNFVFKRIENYNFENLFV